MKVRDDVLEHVLVALLAEGHILVEDYPGVGKTALARALSRSIDCQFARVQCTADLLPADIVGTNVYNQREARFEFRPGPIFANVVLVDEINRASPKTQSGLLECMQERHVTVDAHSHELARPFLVFATQNPVEYEGTYPLPEAQVDRFMVRLVARLPERRPTRPGCSPATRPATACSSSSRWPTAPRCSRPSGRRPPRARLAGAARLHRRAAAPHARRTAAVELGASPRAGLMLLRAAKARALIDGPRPRAARRRPGARRPRARAPHHARARRPPGSSAPTIVADAVAATPAL